MTFIQAFLIALVGVEIAVAAQLLLKDAATKDYSTFLQQYLNFRVIAAYGMMFLSTFFSIIAYRVLPLSFGPIMTALATISVTVLSRVIYHERFTQRKIYGFALIIAGILLFLVPGARIL